MNKLLNIKVNRLTMMPIAKARFSAQLFLRKQTDEFPVLPIAKHT
jgi:hypothetical protein